VGEKQIGGATDGDGVWWLNDSNANSLAESPILPTSLPFLCAPGQHLTGELYSALPRLNSLGHAVLRSAAAKFF